MASCKGADEDDDSINGNVQDKPQRESQKKILDVEARYIASENEHCSSSDHDCVNCEDDSLTNRGYNEPGERHISLVSKPTREILCVSARLLRPDEACGHHTTDKQRKHARSA